MTREQALEKLNSAKLNVDFRIRDWNMGETIFIGINPVCDDKWGINHYKKAMYLAKEESTGRWYLLIEMYAPGPGPMIWFDNLELAVDGTIEHLRRVVNSV